MDVKLIYIGELFKQNLAIPDYQRPYRWKVENAQILFDDLYASFKKNKEGEYRIGSIVLFHDKEDKYYIIDGQQRVTTLLILLYCIGNNEDGVLTSLKYNSLSGKAIKDNQRALKVKCNNIEECERKAFSDYILNNCTFIEIVTENEADSFIYFDSLNSKGKPLSPHDLLKAYHLREASDIDEETKKVVVEEWEKADGGDNLFNFFFDNLYPIVRWSNGLDGNYYDTDKINTFKGIPNNAYPYSEFFKKLENSCFLLSEPFMAGKGFFDFVSKYLKLKNNVEIKINNSNLDTNNYRQADQYVRNLYINVCIFYADRFGIENLDDSALRFFYKWAYTLRINKSKVIYESINRYALYGDYGINAMNIFMEIKKMITPDQIYSINLADCEKPDPNDKSFPFWKSIYGGENE